VNRSPSAERARRMPRRVPHASGAAGVTLNGARAAGLHALAAALEIGELGARLGARLACLLVNGAHHVGVGTLARHQREAERCDVCTIARQRRTALPRGISRRATFHGAAFARFDAPDRCFDTGFSGFRGHGSPPAPGGAHSSGGPDRRRGASCRCAGPTVPVRKHTPETSARRPV
jgi:hypothetical protein